jgi:hypothetical protein
MEIVDRNDEWLALRGSLEQSRYSVEKAKSRCLGIVAAQRW